jgi:type 1 glutamine amidotransferase
VLAQFDLLVPIWTFGELDAGQEQALINAVAKGLGVLAWHGAASAFLGSRAHKFMLGGQFVAHPGGADVTYTVRFLGNDPLVEGLEDITVTSEQYYLLVDPAVKVLASSRVQGGPLDWIAGVEMPVAWTRRWGRGRVFYCSLGHTVDVLQHPSIHTLLRRAARWASGENHSEMHGMARRGLAA